MIGTAGFIVAILAVVFEAFLALYLIAEMGRNVNKLREQITQTALDISTAKAELYNLMYREYEEFYEGHDSFDPDEEEQLFSDPIFDPDEEDIVI